MPFLMHIMPTVIIMHNVQILFQKSIFRENHDMGFLSSSFPEERLNIYRQTIFENMINALRITYPGIWQLIGDDCAYNVAYAYGKKKEYHPTTGCLDDFGHQFPDFLGQMPQLKHMPYLKDYASYEWLKHVAYMAPDCEGISVSELSGIPEEQIDEVTLKFCPSVYFFESSYDLSAIQHILMNKDSQKVQGVCEQSYGIVARQEHDVCTYWLKKENWFFLQALFQGYSLKESTEIAENMNKNFSLEAVIAFLFKAQLVRKII